MKTLWISFLVLAMAAAVACSDSTESPMTDLQDTAQDLGTDTPEDPGPGDVGPEDIGPSDIGPEDIGPSDIGPDDIGPGDVAPDACQRVCTDKVCGADGCGGTCGTCDSGKTCNASGKCEACVNPTTWGPLGMVATAAVPKEATTVETVCKDFTGDSKGDNALASFATNLNGPLQDEITKGFYGAVIELVGVTDWTNATTLTLNAMAAGTETTGSTDLYVNPNFYNPGTCQPYIQTSSASIAAGKLTAGPTDVSMSYRFQEMDLTIAIKQLKVQGDVTHSADGITLANGVVTGYVTKEAIDAIVAKMKDRCDAANPPDWCESEDVLDLIPAAFDLDLNNDKTKDALSLCAQLTLKPAKILGYGVEN